jgi:hypothetical protein
MPLWRFWRRRSCGRRMTDEQKPPTPTSDDDTAHEPERRSIARAVHAYAAFQRSVERYQRSVAEYRRMRATFEEMRTALAQLDAKRDSAAAGRLEIRNAVRQYVQLLRDEARAPEAMLRMTKRTCRSIVLGMPIEQALSNPDALLQDAVRWAIEAYYEAA